MLKWTVVQKKTSDRKKSADSDDCVGNGPCYNIRRAAAKLRRSRTPSSKNSCDKENKHVDGTRDSPRTRDSVYMRLDSIPVALRDVSNHYAAQQSPQTSRLPVKSRSVTKRSRSKTRQTRVSRYSCDEIKPEENGVEHCDKKDNATQHRNNKLEAIRNQIANDTALWDKANKKDLPQGSTTKPNNDESMQIEYSPCPLRTTRSLLALRRRLVDVFTQSYIDADSVHADSSRSHDNPLYYAVADSKTQVNLQQNISPVSSISSENVPQKVKRTNVPCESKSNSCDIRKNKCPLTSNPENIPAGICKSENRTVTSLAQNLASLNISHVPNGVSFLRYHSKWTPPSPFSYSMRPEDIISNHQSRDINMVRKQHTGYSHDVTDPKFLSLFCGVDSTTTDAFNCGMLSVVMSSREQESYTDEEISKCSSVENTLYVPKTCSGDLNVITGRSLRRVRCGTSVSEGEPPVKVSPLDDINTTLLTNKSVHSSNSSRVNYDGKCQDDYLFNHLKMTDFNQSVKSSGGTRNTEVQNTSCDNKISETDRSRNSLERSFSLRRQKGFRKRQRTFRFCALDRTNAKSKEDNNQVSCLSLPHGIPSPFTVQHDSISSSQVTNIKSNFTLEVASYARINVRNSSLDKFRPLDLTENEFTVMKCSDVDVYLSRDTISPNSAISKNDDEDFVSSLGIEGIQPLSKSPILTENEMTKWKRGENPWKSSATIRRDDNGTASCSSSDETWNSHTMHFMKTPHLSDGHILKNGTKTETMNSESENKDDRLSETDALCSPVVLVEKRSRSRRCLLFASPGGSTRRKCPSRKSNSWRKSKECFHSRGELELSIYGNSGLLTVHVISGKNLRKNGGKACNAYVKVNLVPCSEERTFYRTTVHRDSCNPWFNQKFSFEVLDSDMEKRILVSVWHRDREKKRSEFLGCMSFAVKHAVKKEVSGSFRLLSQTAGRTQHPEPGPTSQQQNIMPRQSDSYSVEEIISLESDVPSTPKSAMERRKSCGKKQVESKTSNDDSSFLRHLELEPGDSVPGKGPGVGSAKGGRTPFTTTKKLTRPPGGDFGFSIAWTQPPRIERVEAGQAADHAGLRPGDYVIFVEKQNVVTLPEDEILHLIRSCGNHLTLEIYRKLTPNGFVSGSGSTVTNATTTTSITTITTATAMPIMSPVPHRSSTTTCSATTASLDLSKKRLHLPQVTFSSEAGPLSREESRKRTVYQLLSKEQQYALCMEFGVNRFLVPLSDRKDLITPNDHLTLFQNVEELLRLSEDTLEQLIHEEGEPSGLTVGRVYLKKMPLMIAAYRRYLSGLKNADCLLVTKSRNSDFMRLTVEPPIPRRRPDLTAFIHKPLEHFRNVLKLLHTILNLTKVSEEDYPALFRVVQELQGTYREVTVCTGLMEPDAEGKPLLTLQDLEGRLVFTRCKPFVLSSPGRQWIFGGDLSRVEGRAVRPFWALLFTDLLLFAKVSRDRVLFITEEPLSLLSVTQAYFNIRKRANEFRLLIDGDGEGTDSPAAGGCGPELPLSRNPKKGPRRRTVSLRAPTPELKAVWQNLIQRQIIYLNTARGGTPASSPLDSPDPPTTLSVATLDSISLKRQTPMPDCKVIGNSKYIDELIEHRCRQLGKSGTSKGNALHLAQWMKGQLGGNTTDSTTPEDEPELEIWSPEMLRRRSEQLHVMIPPTRNESRCEDLSDSDRSRSHSTSDSQVTVKSGGIEQQVAVCRQCHKTCLAAPQSPITVETYKELEDDDDDDYEDTWGPLVLMGMTALNATVGLSRNTSGNMDPFSPSEGPLVSVLPPTPDTMPRTSGFQWDDNDLTIIGHATSSASSTSPDPASHVPEPDTSEYQGKLADEEEDDSLDSSLHGDQDPPYKSLSSHSPLKRYGTMASLDIIESDDGLETKDQVANDVTDSEEGESDSDVENENKNRNASKSGDTQQQLEGVAQSLRGWTARAGSYVAEKIAYFEDTRAAAFLDRYLRPNPEPHSTTQGDSPPEQNTASSGTEDYETSAATSGEEVWGTPTSGGELEEEQEGFPPHGGASESPAESTVSSPGTNDDDTELIMEELLAASLPITTRGFPLGRRLEPLPEEESQSESPTSPPCSPTEKEKETPSPEQGSGSGDAADIFHAPVVASARCQHRTSFFNKLRLRRSREESRRMKGNRLLGFLSRNKLRQESGNQNGDGFMSRRPLFRLFNRTSVDDIPTTLPRQLTPRRQNEKQLERRFWKQFKRRRSSSLSSQRKKL